MDAVPVSPLERQQLDVADPVAMTYWHRVRFELVVRHVDATGAQRVLDVGAGSGLFGEWLRQNRPDLGYGFTETSEVLRRGLIERFGPAAEAPEDAQIDGGTVVALLDVLEHIEGDVAALSDLHRRMAPGSELVVTVPAMQWAFSPWDELLGHHRRYSRRTLREALARGGFAEASTTYLFPELFPLLAARKLRTSPREQVDFPRLSPVSAAIGYRVASATAATRRLWPFGTSVVATATRVR
jgi:SAM-dependent methyltransferase